MGRTLSVIALRRCHLPREGEALAKTEGIALTS